MLEIRLMAECDIPQLAEVYLRALENLDVTEKWTQQAAQALLSDWFKRQPDLAFVAEYDAKLVGGFVVGVRPWWDGNHLVDGELFVDVDHQKRGIARALLRKALLTAKDKYAPIIWETYTFRNQRFPLDWYKRLGFQEIEEWVMIRTDAGQLLKNLQI